MLLAPSSPSQCLGHLEREPPILPPCPNAGTQLHSCHPASDPATPLLRLKESDPEPRNFPRLHSLSRRVLRDR